jgi:hypothetical protein
METRIEKGVQATFQHVTFEVAEPDQRTTRQASRHQDYAAKPHQRFPAELNLRCGWRSAASAASIAA